MVNPNMLGIIINYLLSCVEINLPCDGGNECWCSTQYAYLKLRKMLAGLCPLCSHILSVPVLCMFVSLSNREHDIGTSETGKIGRLRPSPFISIRKSQNIPEY